MRGLISRVERLEKTLKPEPDKIPVIIACDYPGDKAEEIAAAREEGKRLIIIHMVKTKEDVEAWRAYRDEH